jgi:hypothetical protein
MTRLLQRRREPPTIDRKRAFIFTMIPPMERRRGIALFADLSYMSAIPAYL